MTGRSNCDHVWCCTTGGPQLAWHKLQSIAGLEHHVQPHATAMMLRNPVCCRFQYGAQSIAVEADRQGKLTCAPAIFSTPVQLALLGFTVRFIPHCIASGWLGLP